MVRLFATRAVDDDGVILLDDSSEEDEEHRVHHAKPSSRWPTTQVARKSASAGILNGAVGALSSSTAKKKAPVAARKAAPLAGYESDEHMQYIIREIISTDEEGGEDEEEDAYEDGDASFDESMAFGSRTNKRRRPSVRAGKTCTKQAVVQPTNKKPRTTANGIVASNGRYWKKKTRYISDEDDESEESSEEELRSQPPPKSRSSRPATVKKTQQRVVESPSSSSPEPARRNRTRKKPAGAKHPVDSERYVDMLSASSEESSEDEHAHVRKTKPASVVKNAIKNGYSRSAESSRKRDSDHSATNNSGASQVQRPNSNGAADSPALASASLNGRPDRDFHALTERISLSELQAQRRAFEQIASQHRRAGVGSSFLSPSSFSPATATTSAARKTQWFESQQKSASLKRSRAGDIEKSATSVLPSPKIVEGASVAAAREATVSITTTASISVSTYSSHAASKPANHTSFEKQSSSDELLRTPAMHGTTWRRLLLARAPSNILSPESKYPLPFADEFDRPLPDFDPTGTLEKQCRILATFGQAQKITEASFNGDAFTQEEMTVRVQNLIAEALPVINECRERRVNSILRGMRGHVASYLHEHQQLRASLLRYAIPHSTFDLAHCERRAAVRLFQNRQLQAPKLNSLVGTVRYFVSREDPSDEYVDGKLVLRVPTERAVYPETVIHLNDEIPALRKSWAYIGVKKNVHVADDPILRYIPYLGENTRVDIDPNRYASTTMDKSRRVEILGSKKGSVLEIKSLPMSALDDETMECLLRLVVLECGDSKKVFEALQQSEKFSQPYSDYCEIKKNEDAARRVLKRVTGVQRLMGGEKAEAVDASAAHQFLNALGRSSWFLQPRPERQSLTFRLKPPIPYFESNYGRFPQGGGLRKTTDYGDSTEWYRDLFCRRCYTYDCDEHGIMQPTPLRRTDPIYPVVLRAGIAHRRRIAESNSGGDASSPRDPESGHAIKTIPSSTAAAATDVIELVDSSSDGEESIKSDVQAPASASASDDESTVRRRSKRSQTRISTMASASLKVQEEMQEKDRRRQRRADLKRFKQLTRAVDSSEYLDDSYVDVVMDAVTSILSTETPCSPECRKNDKDVTAAVVDASMPSSNAEHGNEQALVDKHPPLVFNESETLLLRKLSSTLGDNSCLLAALLKSPTCTCSRISRFLAAEQDARLGNDGEEEDSQEWAHPRSLEMSSRRRQKSDRRSGASHSHSVNRELLKRTRAQRHLEKGNSHCYQPCNHEGICDGCECMKRGHCCDKACACSRDCPNRFQGCKCSMGNCRTKSCPCYSAGRECDPDHCFSCGASDAAVMVVGADPERRLCYELGICCNSNLLRGAQRKIGVSFSTTHGWGAFALERIRRGEFLYEYTGALISDDEAERRGNIYDVMAISFLFDVNSDEVVDATRKGNKSKFANHKATVSANCEAKILIVNGEHRIALYARDDIEIGEELFFDYGYTHETAPQWSQVKQRGSQRCEIPRHEWDIMQQFEDEDDDDGDY